MKLLVVEDEPEASELLEAILVREGCEVLHARDGADALEIARELPHPDLVLLDLELPIMDGRRFLESLRSDPTTSGIPVVVLSAAPDATKVRATDNVDKSHLLDGLARVIARLRLSMSGPVSSKTSEKLDSAVDSAPIPA